MSFSIGPPAGWRTEERRLQKVVVVGGGEDYLMLSVICRGEHTDLCYQGDEGWVCSTDCPVEDMPRIGSQAFEIVVDELLEVRKSVVRTRRHIWKVKIPWKVSYQAERVSAELKAVNGRRRKNARVGVTYRIFYEGECWTKRRARRELERRIQADTVEVR